MIIRQNNDIFYQMCQRHTKEMKKKDNNHALQALPGGANTIIYKTKWLYNVQLYKT